MLLKKLLRTAWSYKAQFISMIIMTAIGIGVFLGFNIEWHSIETNTEKLFSDTKYADFRAYSEAGFTSEELERIADINGIDGATRYLSVNVGLENSSRTLTLNVSENYTVSTMLVVDGEEYDPTGDGIWLSDRFAEECGISIGDRLTMTYGGAKITGVVVGLAKSGENMICVADSDQIMPDFSTHGFAYISPALLEKSIGEAFYPQINIISSLEKDELEQKVGDALGVTLRIIDKSLHTAYAGAQSEADEGRTMGSILPVLFLAIAVLTMVTTMHRLAAGEKTQIGTLKALGFRDGKILLHYTSYGLFIGGVGSLLGIALGYGIAAAIMSPHGMMSTYLDLPEWRLTMPSFCIPVVILTLAFLTLISFLSTRKMLGGTASEALRPYTPKISRKTKLEETRAWNALPFSVKWNLRDIMRHKARSLMTLLGVFGCMLLIVGALGMNDTMKGFLDMLGEDTADYRTRVDISQSADQSEALALAEELQGDRKSSLGISYNGKTVSLDIYGTDYGRLSFLTEDGDKLKLPSDGVVLCLRLRDTSDIGDTIEFSPYGSDKTYTVRVAGYFRSLVNECIIMSEDYAHEIGIEYSLSSIYTDLSSDEITSSPIISAKQDRAAIMSSYDSFMSILNMMIAILIAAAAVLGVVVLYALGSMSYVERRRELATLKVLGFRDKAVGRILISQNMYLTALGIILGIPGGTGVVYAIINSLASEYELCITFTPATYILSTLLTAGVSLAVAVAVARKSKKIDMVEALKGAE